MWEEGQQVIVAPLLLFHSPSFAFPMMAHPPFLLLFSSFLYP